MRRSNGKQAILTLVFIVMMWVFIFAVAFDNCAGKVAQ